MGKDIYRAEVVPEMEIVDAEVVHEPVAKKTQPSLPSGEVALVSDARDESIEKPRAIVCGQYLYGKQIDAKGDRLPGFEHSCIGRTPWVKDKELQKFCDGSTLFAIRRDSLSYDDYRFPEGGQIVKKAFVSKEGIPYVFLACNKGLREEPSKSHGGRYYSSMHVLVVPVAEYSIALLPQLTAHLQPRGLRVLDSNMKELSLTTETLDQELPTDWFSSDVREMVARLLSGQSFAVVDTQQSGSQFLNQLFLALLCLPQDVARQISFGSALQKSVKGQVRVAHTQDGNYDVMKTRKRDGTTSWNQEMNINDIQFSTQYLSAITQVIPTCRTPRAVMKAVKSLPSALILQIRKRFQG